MTHGRGKSNSAVVAGKSVPCCSSCAFQRIENKVHLFGGDPDHERIQRIVLSALR